MKTLVRAGGLKGEKIRPIPEMSNAAIESRIVRTKKALTNGDL
jgi:hypothetical protein